MRNAARSATLKSFSEATAQFVRDEDDDEVILAGERDGETERLLKSHFSETKNILNCSKCGAGGDRDGEEEDSKTEDAVTMCVCTHGWA